MGGGGRVVDFEAVAGAEDGSFFDDGVGAEFLARRVPVAFGDGELFADFY